MTDETTTEQLAEIEGQAVPVQVREGQWRTRGRGVRDVTRTPPGHELADDFPWWDGSKTFRNDGRYAGFDKAMDLVEYLGPIEQQPQTQPQPPMLQDADQMIRLLSEANHNHVAMIGRLQGRINDLETIRDNQAATIEELRSEVSYVQNLLGTEKRRVAQLEDLVASLRTINEAQEKAFTAAGKANTDLQHRLNVVAAEWAEQAETSRRLQIELDAAQQVPQAIADRFEEGWNQGTARAVETVLEWLGPIRAVDHLNLSNETLQHLPQIMRHLTGLAQD